MIRTLPKAVLLTVALALSTPPARAADAAALAAALSAAQAGDWDGAAAAARPAGSIAADLIEWQRLRAGQGSFDAHRARLGGRAVLTPQAPIPGLSPVLASLPRDGEGFVVTF